MSGHLAASALIKRTGPCDKTVIGPGLDKPAVGPASAENGLGSAARADTEAFVQNGQPQSFFQLSWLALQKPRAREICARMMTGRKFLSPPAYGSLRHPITGAPRARKLKLFPIWPAAILFRAKLACPTRSTRAGSCATTDDRAQISQPPSYGSLRNPITGAPRARKLKLFSNMARRSPFSWLALQTARKFLHECRVRGN